MWNANIEQAVTIVSTCCVGCREESDSADGSLGCSAGTWDMLVVQKGYPMRQFTRRHRESFLPSKTTFFLPSIRLKIWDLENLGSDLLLESMKVMSRCYHGFPLPVLWFELEASIPCGECLLLSGEVVWYLRCPSFSASVVPGRSMPTKLKQWP